MTVEELIERLRKQPQNARVRLRIDAEGDVWADYLAKDETEAGEEVVVIVSRE